MKVDLPNARRWNELIELDAFGELTTAEGAELDALGSLDPTRAEERRLLLGLRSLVPPDPILTASDEALINALVARAPVAARPRTVVPWVVAAAVFVPLAAAAAHSLWTSGNEDVEEGTAVATSSVPVLQTTLVTPARTSPPEVEQDAPLVATVVPGSSAAPSSTQRLTAAELLARAQEARAARDYSTALQSYRLLLRQHPNSGEARLARLSSAQLELAQGNPAAALAGFDAYRRSGGPLEQEAHYGRILALRELGRRAEERLEIERFIARYPNSVQRAALAQRLNEDGERD